MGTRKTAREERRSMHALETVVSLFAGLRMVQMNHSTSVLSEIA